MRTFCSRTKSASVARAAFVGGFFLLTEALPFVAVAQSAPEWADTAIYDVDHLNAYTARVGWRIVSSVGNSTTVCRGGGSAIFLGGNLFITAAHVVDQNPKMNDCARAGPVDPFIEFGSTTLKATVIAIQHWDDEPGSTISYPDGTDLALLKVDTRMMQPELRSDASHRLCNSDLSVPGTEVRVSTQYGVYSATTLANQAPYSRFDFAVKRGDSGGGVFDAQRHCLLGIISSGSLNGANYVMTGVVRRFLDKAMAVQAMAVPR